MKKKVALIIAFRDFQEKEYSDTKGALEKAGVKVDTFNARLQEINIGNYDAVVFIGGGGALKYLDNNICYKIIQETLKAGKILGAICISPVIAAKAGVLAGKRATVWSSSLDQWPIKTLKENGAEYIDKDVVVDGKIVTANGPSAATKFGEKIIELLTKI